MHRIRKHIRQHFLILILQLCSEIKIADHFSIGQLSDAIIDGACFFVGGAG